MEGMDNHLLVDGVILGAFCYKGSVVILVLRYELMSNDIDSWTPVAPQTWVK